MRISEHTSSSFIVKLAGFFSKRRFGKVIAPLRTIYAHQPALLTVAMKIDATQKKLSLDNSLKRLIPAFTSSLNQCSFCSDIDLLQAEKANIEKQKLKVLLNFRNEPRFSDREKTALLYCEEITLTKQCSDETFSMMRMHFTEQEIVEITWLNATANYFNLQAIPLGLSSDELSTVDRFHTTTSQLQEPQ